MARSAPPTLKEAITIAIRLPELPMQFLYFCFTKKIEISNNEIIKNFKQGESGTLIRDGREAEELVLRFFALNNNLDDYDNKLSKYFDKFMKSKSDVSTDEIDPK